MHVFIDTVVCTTVSCGKSSCVGVFVGLLPLLLFALLFSEWRNANLAGGFACRWVFVVSLVFLFILICHTACDQSCPCGFFTRFFSCKDRVLERHRPYQRKKKSGSAGKPLNAKQIHEPWKQALLHTGAPGCPAESNTGARQCSSLQCSLSMASAGDPSH